MSILFEMWLAILLATVALWVCSFITWALSPHHKPDYKGFELENEEKLKATITGMGIAPGQYMFPYVEHSDMKDPEKMERYNRGPHGTLVYWPARPNMARNMILTIVYFAVCTKLVVYLTGLGIGAVADSKAQVFQFTAIAFGLCFVFGGLLESVWFWKPPRTSVTNALDGVFYSLAGAGVLTAFWQVAQPITG